jgi:predicted DCC family thiol-disulfide oxidoreductase YuxK
LSNHRIDGAMLTVYFDGSCPVCVAEMGTLRDARPDLLALVDVSADGFHEPWLASRGLDRAALMASLHVRDGDDLIAGVPAFARIYQRVGMTGVAATLDHPRWASLLAAAYRRLAPYRGVLRVFGLHRLLAWWLRAKLARMQHCSSACPTDAR